jgi:hypothetical protein
MRFPESQLVLLEPVFLAILDTALRCLGAQLQERFEGLHS